MRNNGNRFMGKVAQTLNRRSGLGRTVAAVAIACLLWFAATGTGLADMRIVTEAEGVRTESLFKGNRIATPMADGSNFILHCDTGELTMISPLEDRRYWRGTFGEFKESIEALFAGVSSEMGDAGAGMPDLGSLLGALFGGGNDAEETLVRVTKKGSETIAGYATDHYVVETGTKGNWKVYEELWLSSKLLNELMAEVGSCVDMMLELQDELTAMGSFGIADLDAVLASPDYQRLMQQGFLMRNKQTMRVFGMEVDASSEVVEVNRQSIGEDAFAVPAGYQRIDSPFELISGM